MDKKISIIIGILVLLVIGLIIGAFVADSKDDSILTINDIGYGKAGFENYYKVRYFEEVKSNSNNTVSTDEGELTVSTDSSDSSESTNSNEVNKEELKSTALNEYATYMIIAKEAKEKGFKLSDDDIKAIEEKYDAEDFDRELLTSLGVTREGYIEVQKVVETYNKFLETIDEYYEVPQNTIDSYFELNKDSLKGIDFRIMQFNITSSEATTNEDGEEIPATTNKDEVVAKAQDILERVKAGEDFETLAKENANQRYALTNAEFKPVNGELESCDLPYLQNYFLLGGSEIVDPLKALTTPGEYTDIVTTDSYVIFARLEAVRDDIQEETREAMIKSFAQNFGESYLSSVVQSSKVITNAKLLKSIEI